MTYHLATELNLHEGMHIEDERALIRRCYPSDGGLSWHLGSIQPWSIGLSLQGEGMDAIRSTARADEHNLLPYLGIKKDGIGLMVF